MKKFNRIYKVTYKGLWLSGKAVVIACDENDAIEKVKHHCDTVAFENVEVEEICSCDVIYNDNGAC